ncbi:MAG: cytochrome c [Acidobacteriia bacterium]|nr:cytochrome c [Terriglobia bacterium]
MIANRTAHIRTVILLITASVPCLLAGCSAQAPGRAETVLVDGLKRQTIGGHNWVNPIPDTADNIKIGQEHFEHHCAVCHGLDGHNTGVPFATKMSPPVADLGERDVQGYNDGQLKWIVQNGLRFTGMPGWSGILDDREMWHVVRFMRHLPRRGSLGAPPMYRQVVNEHHAPERGAASTEKKAD